ncbi:MAG: RimK family alpha-L-glutamate ligase [Sulfuriferula sp.]
MTRHWHPLMQLYACEPPKLIGLPTLMRMALHGEDLTPLGTDLLAYVAEYPQAAHALMDMSTVFQLMHDAEMGLMAQAEALKLQQLYPVQDHAGDAPLRLLVMMGPGDLMSNTPVEFLVADENVQLSLLYVDTSLPLPDWVPDHDVLFVAVGESDKNRALLAFIGSFIRVWPRPVLNPPAKIAAVARDQVSVALQHESSIVMPQTVRVMRAQLIDLAAGVLSVPELIDATDYPVIVRPVDSHAGHGLAQITSGDELTAYLAEQTGEDFYLARFVDYSDAAGRYRKYRIVLMHGQPYLCHLAISRHWMVHYLNAEMTENALNRAEEAQVMASFDDDFAVRHAQALSAIAVATGLDYVGIDCAETAQGQLLVFEIDSNMVVHAMDDAEMFPYKQPQMRKVFHAFHDLLVTASGAH